MGLLLVEGLLTALVFPGWVDAGSVGHLPDSGSSSRPGGRVGVYKHDLRRTMSLVETNHHHTLVDV